MSQPTAPEGRPAPRYQRSSGGLLGAMIVCVLAVVALVGLRALTDDPPPDPARPVDYATQVEAGRADGSLAVWSPPNLPVGWKATSAEYTTGVDPTWHLGLLTGDGRYVGVEEARDSVEDLVEQHVDEDAEQGEDVTLGGAVWQTWTDAGGDHAVSRELGEGRSLLVVGSAPPEDVRRLAESLTDR